MAGSRPGRARPADIAVAIDFAHTRNLDVQKAFFQQIRKLDGGTCGNMVG